MSETIKVFLVDDDLLFAEASEHFLLSSVDVPLEIYKYQNGKDCLDNLNKQPQLLILDYYLEEDTNGIEVLKKIKDYDQDINVIILTGQDDAKVAHEAINAGADYLCKSDSAFVKIKKIILTLEKHKSITQKLKKEANVYKNINIWVIAILIILFILSRILQ